MPHPPFPHRAHGNHIAPGGLRQGNGVLRTVRPRGSGWCRQLTGPPDRGGTLTIAIAAGRVDVDTPAVPPRRSRRRLVKRIFLVVGAGLFALVATLATLVGVSLWRIDHNVHHVGVPAALLAKGKNDLLAIVQGPNHSEEAYVFHQTASTTKVLTIPSGLALPAGRRADRPAQVARHPHAERHHPRAGQAGHPGQPLRRRRPPCGQPVFEPGPAGERKALHHVDDLEPDRHQLAAGGGGVAHLPRTRHPGLRRPVPHERPHGTPGPGPDVSGFLRATWSWLRPSRRSCAASCSGGALRHAEAEAEARAERSLVRPVAAARRRSPDPAPTVEPQASAGR